MVRRKRTSMLFTSFNPLVPEPPCPLVSATPRQYFMAWARTESGTANPRFCPTICVLVWHCRKDKCRIANGSSWRTNIFQIQHTAYNSFRRCSNCAERSCLTECPFFGDIVSRKCADIFNAFFVITPIPRASKTIYTLHKCPRQMSHDGTAESEPHRRCAIYSAQLIWRAVASFTSKSPNVSAIIEATGKAARQEETNVWQGNAKWIEKCKKWGVQL